MDNSKLICRGCMSTNLNEFVNFFDNQLSIVYQLLTNLPATFNDGLPNVICIWCQQNLQNLKIFKEQCIESYNALKNQGNIKVKCEQIMEIKTGHISENDYEHFGNDEYLTYTEPLQITQGNFENYNCKAETEECVESQKIYKYDLRKSKTNVKFSFLGCELCNNILKRKYLNSHMQTHDLHGKAYKCDVCSRRFGQLHHLKGHIISKHTNREKTISCPSCDRKFNDEKALNNHRVIHLDVLPFSCNVCNKQFVSSKTLKVHSRLHTDKKPYLCSICAQSFSQSTHLQFHMNLHTGNRPFACKLCLKTFAQPSNLIEHEQRHHSTKNKPRDLFTCPICSKQYNEKRSLTRHIVQHTAEKKHICEICSKGFFDSNGLKRHRLVHSSEKKFVCPICDKYLTRKDHLKAHMRKHETRSKNDF